MHCLMHMYMYAIIYMHGNYAHVHIKTYSELATRLRRKSNKCSPSELFTGKFGRV